MPKPPIQGEILHLRCAPVQNDRLVTEILPHFIEKIQWEATWFPALPGCYTQGDTIDEALENIEEAILLCVEDMQAQSQPILDMSRVLVSSVAVTYHLNILGHF